MTSFLPQRRIYGHALQLCGQLRTFLFDHSATSLHCTPDRRAGVTRQLSRVRKKAWGLHLVLSGFRSSRSFIGTHVIAASRSLILECAAYTLRSSVWRTIAASRIPNPITRLAVQFSGLVGCSQHFPGQPSDGLKTINFNIHSVSPFRRVQRDMEGLGNVPKRFGRG